MVYSLNIHMSRTSTPNAINDNDGRFKNQDHVRLQYWGFTVYQRTSPPDLAKFAIEFAALVNSVRDPEYQEQLRRLAQKVDIG